MAQAPTLEQNVFPEQGPLPNAGGADFGAQIGQATEGLGQNIGQAGDVMAQHILKWQNLKNEATASDLDVQFQGDLGNLEDGFYSLKGKAQADAYPKFQQDLTALRQKYLGAAPNPMVQNMLGQSVAYSVGRSLRSAGTTAGEATRNWMIDSSASRVNSLIYNSAKRFSDQEYADTTNAAIEAGVRNLGEIQGWSEDHIKLEIEQQKDALLKRRQDNAQAFLKGQPVAAVVHSLVGDGGGEQGKVGGAEYHQIAGAIESSNNAGVGTNASGHTGLFQASADWWKQYGGGGDINKAADQHAALDRETADNLPKLKAALGREPTNADLYLAHQQGLDGAIKILTHPDVLASQSVPAANIASNLPQGSGDPNTITGSQFASLWAAPFSQSGGLMPNNPAGPNKQIDAAVATLSDEQKQILTKEQLTAWRVQSDAAYTDQQHQQTLADKQKKLTLDTADAQIQQIMMAHDRDPKQQGVDLLKVAQSPLYADQPERIKSLIAFQKALDKPDGEAGASARNTSAMFGKMFPSDGSAPLSQKDIDAAFVSQDPDRHINKSDYDWLTKQAEGAKDPTSQRINGQLNDVAKVVERQIDPSITGSMGTATHSPFSGTRMLQWKQAVADKIAAFKAAGKDPAVLFDPTPGNKDYVGSAGFTAPYTRSMTDLMTEEATGTEAQPAAPVAAPVATPEPVAAAVTVPPELPKGTTYAGKLKDGRDAYRLPDGTLRALAAPQAADTGPAVPTGP